MNDGKIFEKDWKDSSIKQEVFILRLNDSSLSWQHEKQSRFTVENPCDFIQFINGTLFTLELKSTKYSSISIQTDISESKMIKIHQINSLSNFSLYDNICSGFILNFRDDSLENNNVTYFLSIKNFNDFFVETQKKSINKLDIITHGGIIIEQNKKRTHYNYNVKKALLDIIEQQRGG